MVDEDIGLEAITDSKIVNLKRVSKFMDDILSGKINNKYDAEKMYREIMEDENLLRNYKNFSRNKNTQKIATIINNLRYAYLDLCYHQKTMLMILKMLILETKRQKGHGLKIMTSSQLTTRLPISLAQKQAGNNSQKLKNEITQIIYYFYRSKNLSKTIYNYLINNM